MPPGAADTRPLVRTLLRWYRKHGRDLPWRLTRDPYRILLSEIMLQQTQVSRVLEKYPLFLRRFPTIRSLARARQKTVVRQWQGMGYNNRAVRLHRLAREVATRHNGRIPRDRERLLALPGVGRYTADAILSSAFRIPAAPVDVNIRRVLSRLFHPIQSWSSLTPEREIREHALHLLPPRDIQDWNQALMDLGATTCTARAPRCEECPLSHHCLSAFRMTAGPSRIARREPSRGGIPNRIYRGRIIELLRSHANTRGITAAAVGRAVFPSFSSRDTDWLRQLLAGLERDGLIATSEKNGRVTLR